MRASRAQAFIKNRVLAFVGLGLVGLGLAGCVFNAPVPADDFGPSAADNAALTDAGDVDVGYGDAEMDASSPDAPLADAGFIDAASTDADPIDAGPADADPTDADPIDAGPADADPTDADPIDAGPADADPTDAAPLDTGVLPTVTRMPGGTSPLRGFLGGGAPFEDDCGPDEVVIGLQGDLDTGAGFVHRVQARCGRLTVQPGPTIVIVPNAATTPVRGLLFGAPYTRDCPPNEVPVAMAGRSGRLIDQLQLQCAPLVLRFAPLSVEIGTAGPVPPIGGTGGNPFPLSECPQNQIASGIRGRAGDSLDAFGLRCSTLVARP